MNYIKKYQTPEGFSDLVMVSDGNFLTALYFEKGENAENVHGEEKDLPVFDDTARWLDRKSVV